MTLLQFPMCTKPCVSSDHLFEAFNWDFSQGGKGTKVHVYLPYRGAFSFYVYIILSGLLIIFLDVECDEISCGLQPTRFFLNFLQNYNLQKKGEISDLFLGKIIYVIKKVIKTHI